MTLGWGESLCNAWISRKLVTWPHARPPCFIYIDTIGRVTVLHPNLQIWQRNLPKALLKHATLPFSRNLGVSASFRWWNGTPVMQDFIEGPFSFRAPGLCCWSCSSYTWWLHTCLTWYIALLKPLKMCPRLSLLAYDILFISHHSHRKKNNKKVRKLHHLIFLGDNCTN